MRKLTPIESHVVFWVDTGSSRAAILRNQKGGASPATYPETEVLAAVDGLLADGTLTASSKSDWLVVSEWMPNAAESMRKGEK